MSKADQGKTEDPTQKRLKDAKDKGDIPRSKDMSATMSLIFSLIFFILFLPNIGGSLVQFWKSHFNFGSGIQLSSPQVVSISEYSFAFYLKILIPLFLILFAVAFLMEIVQGGFKIVPENLKINFSKFNIVKGLKKIVGSPEAFFELIKSLVKVIIIGIIAYITIKSEIPNLIQLPYAEVITVLKVMGMVFLKLTASIILFLAILSVFDYLFQKHRYKDKLRMSKDDVKDEYKQMEGDPMIKSRQKKLQYQKALQRMMTEVPKADVIITNPAHYAVALKYEFKKMKSPKVLAKGKDLVAERIKNLARKKGVPIVENPPIARAIYKLVEVNEFIPSELFKPVAEILAYIYKLKGKKIG